MTPRRIYEESAAHGWTVRAWRRGSSWSWSATDQGGIVRCAGGYEPSRYAAIAKARAEASLWRAPTTRLRIVRCYGCRLLELADINDRTFAGSAGRMLQRHRLDASTALAEVEALGLRQIAIHLRWAAASDGLNGAEWRPL